MAEWTNEELETIDDRDELRIATRRTDGSLRRPVTVWMVRHGDDVFVRSVNGRDELDAAYETKYGGRYASIVPSIVAPHARAATLKLVPDAEEES